MVFMLPSGLSGALLRNVSIEEHPVVNASSLLRQSSVDEKQLLTIQQQLARAWSCEIEHSSSAFSRPSGSRLKLTVQFGHALPCSTTPSSSGPYWLRA